MAVNVPPIPYNVPMTNEAGLPSPAWADWFRKLMARVGGNDAATVGSAASISSAMLQADSVTAAILKDSAATDSDRAVTADHIRNSAVTTDKINNGAVNFFKLLSTDWSASAGLTSGYLKLGSGIYVQWGVTGSIGTGTTSTISFVTAFPNRCGQVVVTVKDNSARAVTVTGQPGVGNYTTTGFDLYNRCSVDHVFSWIAIGN